MSEGFSIPVEVVSRIEELFPESVERRKISFTLMHWNKKPSTNELKEIGESVQRGTSTVYKVLQKLMEAGLFANDLGSLPLYRHNEQIRYNLTMDERTEVIKLPEPSEKGVLEVAPVESVAQEEETFTVEPEEVKHPVSVTTPPSPALDKRVSFQEAEIKNIKSTMDNRFGRIEEMIQGLSVAPADDNPGDNPVLPPVIQSTPAVPRGQLSTEDRLAEIEQRLQNSDASTDPLENLSLEQIKELVRNQPQELAAMVNPATGNPGGRVSATEVTLRPIIVMMTTYTQMLFEKIVHDGYFEGTLSDFLNFAAEQYFTDRGWSLDWNKREPANRRRRLG